jgi:hypothetical protein
VLVAAIVIGAAAPAKGEGWRRIGPVPAAPVTALAADGTGRHIAAASGGKVYVSHDGGRYWHGAGGADGEVLDLVFLDDGPRGGTLIAAGENGVRMSRDGFAWRPADLTGAAGRGAVHAVIHGPPGEARLALGTDGGVLLADRLEAGWRAVSVALPGRPVHRLAWTPGGSIVAGSEAGLYRIDPARPGTAQRVAARAVRDVAASGDRALAATDRGALISTEETDAWREIESGGAMSRSADAVAALPGEPGVFLLADSRQVWRIAPETAPRAVADAPPGEATRALLPLPGKLLAATDRGLYESPLPDAPERSVELSGQASLASLAATDLRRLWREDPPIAQVRRAALRASHLEPGRIRRNFRGVRVRALLPEFRVSLRQRRVRHRDQDQDQVFTSGALRHLFDTSRDLDLDRDLVLTAEWDLGSLLFHPDELDVSEEARRVLALRDDVLDEVNQIYFERRRAMLSLAGLAGSET